MKFFICFLLTIISLALIAQETSPINTKSASLEAHGFKLRWKALLPTEPTLKIERKINLILVQTEKKLYALNPKTGKLSWNHSLEEALDFSPTSNENHVAFTAGSVLHLIDLQDGELLWKQPLCGDAISPPALDGQHVYIGSSDQHLYAYQLTSRPSWRSKLSDEIVQAPLITKKAIYVGTKDNHFHALSFERGALQWKVSLEGSLTVSPQMKEQSLYLTAENNNSYQLDSSNGKTKWKIQPQKGTFSSSYLTEKLSYFATTEFLLGVENQTGKTLFRLAGNYQLLVKDKQKIYALYSKGKDKHLVGINCFSGAQELDIKLSDVQEGIPNNEDPTIYLRTTNNEILAFTK